MTQGFKDDVTGKQIDGDTERWYRVYGIAGADGSRAEKDVVDLDTFLEIIRDHLTSKSPGPLDLSVAQRVPGALPPQLAKYDKPAPAAEAPKPFMVPPLAPRFTYLTYPKPGLTPPSQDQLDRLTDQLARRRKKYVAALAELCGCNNPATHEKVGGIELP